MVKGKSDIVAREYTVHLHKRLHGTSFKKRAPKAVKVLRKFAEKMMKTDDNRVDAALNKELWRRGIRNVPHRIRVRLSRKRKESDDGEELYTVISYVPCETFKGTETETVEDA